MERTRAPLVVLNPRMEIRGVQQRYMGIHTCTHNKTNGGTTGAPVNGKSPPNAHDAGACVEEALLGIPIDVLAIFPTRQIFVVNRSLADRNTFTGEHALIHDCIAREEKQVRGEYSLWRMDKIDHVPGH